MTVTQPAEWGLILLSGFLGSAHCLGMCGGIALTMNAGSRSPREALFRQSLWSLGRLVTYIFLGIAAATFGARLIQTQSDTVRLQAIMALIAGSLLLIEGLRATGWLRWKSPARPAGACVVRSVFARFLVGGSGTGAFIGGLLTGFLPCGLVYSFLALAAGTARPLQGAGVMACFGLGTIPLLMTTITGLSAAPWELRQKLLRLAAFGVVLTGLLTASRGALALNRGDQSAAGPGCPLCLVDPPAIPADGETTK